MQNKKSYLGISAFIFILVLISLKDCGFLSPEPYYNPPVTSHQAIGTLGMKEVWLLENVFIGDDNLNPMMVASQGIVVFLGGLDINDRSTVTGLGASEGDLRWHTEFGIPTTIFATPDAVYIGRSGGASIVSYDLKTGETIWNTSLSGTRGLSYLTVIGDDAYVQTSATQSKFFVLNATTGEIVSQKDGRAVFLSTDEVTIKRSIISNELEAVDPITQETKWLAKFDHRFLMVPVFTENEILIRTDFGRIYCLDRDTGNVLWSTENIALSNLAIGRELIYFLTRDGKLLGVDLHSGEEKSFVQFDTDRFVLNGEVHIGGYHVAYDPETDMVFSALGDSAQLFAFQSLDD